MGFFSKSRAENRQSREPQEVAQLSRNLRGAVWIAEREEGPPRIDWDIARLRADGSIAKTKRVSDLLEMPEAICALARVFSAVPSISPDLRDQLARLATALEGLREKVVYANGENGNGEGKLSVFNSPIAA